MALGTALTSSGSISSGTSMATSFHASWAAGDLAILFCHAAGDVTTSAPSGWTGITGSPVDDGFVLVRGYAFQRLLQGGDSAPTVTWSASGGSKKWIMLIVPADGTPTLLASGSAADTGFGTASGDPPSLNAGSETVNSYVYAGGEGTVDQWAAPTNWTELVEERGADFVADCALFERTGQTGTVNPGTATSGGSGDDIVFHVLVYDVAGGGGATPKGVFGKALDGPLRRVVYP